MHPQTVPRHDAGPSHGQKYRLAALLSYPVHYLLGFYRKLAKEPDVDLTVYLCSDFGMRSGYDTTFERTITWYDASVLAGVPHRFLANWSPRDFPGGFWDVINPSIVGEIRKNRYDAVMLHGYTYATNYLAFLAAKSVGTKVFIRGESHLLNARSLHLRALKRVLLPSLFAASAALLPVGILNERYYRHYGVPDTKLFRTPYTVDNEFYRTEAARLSPERSSIRRSLGIPEHVPVILFASKLIARKRPMDLLKAYEQILGGKSQTAGGAIHLLFAGDGPERPVLERYAEERGMRNIHFTGFVAPFDLPRFYAIANLFAFPSGFETWGLVVNEAMNFGLPVITTDMVGSSHNLIRHGENGFVHAVGDVGALARYLTRLLNDERLRHTMGTASLERIDTWSNREAVAGVMEALRSL